MGPPPHRPSDGSPRSPGLTLTGPGRVGLATVLRLPLTDWDARRTSYGVELRHGRYRLRVVLNPWSIPPVRAAIRGDRVVIERWEDGGY
ncbi:hypothetical protein [Methanopyrus kandleri]